MYLLKFNKGCISFRMSFPLMLCLIATRQEKTSGNQEKCNIWYSTKWKCIRIIAFSAIPDYRDIATTGITALHFGKWVINFIIYILKFYIYKDSPAFSREFSYSKMTIICFSRKQGLLSWIQWFSYFSKEIMTSYLGIHKIHLVFKEYLTTKRTIYCIYCFGVYNKTQVSQWCTTISDLFTFMILISFLSHTKPYHTIQGIQPLRVALMSLC